MDKEMQDYLQRFAKECSVHDSAIKKHPELDVNWGANKPNDAIKKYNDFMLAHRIWQESAVRGQQTILGAQTIIVKALRQGATKEHPYIVGIWGVNKKYAQAHKEALEKIFAQWGVAEFIKLDVVEFKKKPYKEPQIFMDDLLRTKKHDNKVWITYD